MAKFGVKDFIAMKITRKTENGDCEIVAAMRTAKGVVAKRATMTRFGWVNAGILIAALDGGNELEAEEANALFGESMKGFLPEPVANAAAELANTLGDEIPNASPSIEGN